MFVHDGLWKGHGTKHEQALVVVTVVKQAITNMSSSYAIDTRRSLLTALLERTRDPSVDDVEGAQLASIFYKESRDDDLRHLYDYAMTIPRFKHWAKQKNAREQRMLLEKAVRDNDARAVTNALATTLVDDATRTDMAVIALQESSFTAWTAIVSGDKPLCVAANGSRYLREALRDGIPQSIFLHGCECLKEGVVKGSLSPAQAFSLLDSSLQDVKDDRRGGLLFQYYRLLQSIVLRMSSSSSSKKRSRQDEADDDDDSSSSSSSSSEDEEEAAESLSSLSSSSPKQIREDRVAALTKALQETFKKSSSAAKSIDEVSALLAKTYPSILTYAALPNIALGKALVRVFGTHVRGTHGTARFYRVDTK